MTAKEKLQIWFRINLCCLVIVALYGSLMRYKIAFNFPFLEQKNLLHAHSHFAFNAWISMALYCGLALKIGAFIPMDKLKKYIRLIALNLIFALGMLVSFTIQGYGIYSISFSALSIGIAVLYTIYYIRDTKYFPKAHPTKPWAIMGLVLNLVSAVGPLTLAYMMMSKNVSSEMYLGLVYYYLHFQYSGWFFFGGMAIVVSYLPLNSNTIRRYFYILAFTVFPSVFLSLLWTKLPNWLYWITVIASLVQLITWLTLILKLRTVVVNKVHQYPSWVRIFFYAASFSLTLKFLLQSISAIPELNQLVFGFRPIVIGYLHLVLLGIYTLFFIGYYFSKGFLHYSVLSKVAALSFLVGVVLNELLLAIQGFAAFAYIPIPYINEMLFAAAIILFGSALSLAISQFIHQKE